MTLKSTVTPGVYDLYKGTKIVVQDRPTLEKAVEAALGLGKGSYTVRTTSKVLIEEVATIPPVDPPTPPIEPPVTSNDISKGLPVVTTTPKPMASIPRPILGGSFIDSYSGSKTIRITDIAAQGGKVIKPAYSTVPAWNIDESYLILYIQGSGHVLYNGKTYAPIKKLDIAPADIEHFYWSSTDPDVLFYPWAYEASGVSKREIIKYHVSTGQKETYYAIPDSAAPGAYRVDFGGDPVYGDWSNLLFGLRRRGSSDTGFVWSREKGETPRVSGDCPQVTPSGTKYIQNGKLFKSDGTLIRSMQLNTQEHGDLTRLANGQDVWVSVQFDGPKGSGQVLVENLDTGAVNVVIGQANGYGYPKSGTHISGHGIKVPGWVAVSITGEPDGKSLLSQSILLIDLNTNRSFYAGYHHSAGSDGPNGYWAEPHINISPSGTRLLFGSDWGSGNIVDSYIVELPSYKA